MRRWHTFIELLGASLVVLIIAVGASSLWAEEKKPKTYQPPKRDTPVEKIEGYGPFKFRMKLSSALEINNEMRIFENKGKDNKCDFHGYKSCGILNTNVFGEKADLILQSKDNKLISRILLQFNRLDDKFIKTGACQKALKTVIKYLVDRYGMPTRSVRNSYYWDSPYGGSVGLVKLCIGNDHGIVIVTYSDTYGF